MNSIYIDPKKEKEMFKNAADVLAMSDEMLAKNRNATQPVKHMGPENVGFPKISDMIKKEEKPKKIKIVWASMHCCIRVIKLAKALISTGRYEIHGVASQVSYGTNFFDTFSFYHNAIQFENIIRTIPADIYIHSNEPSWQLNRIREIMGSDVKLILDGHDFDSIRQGAIPINEMKAFTNADGVLFVSAEIEDFIQELHIGQLAGKPTAVIEHYCNKEWHILPQHAENQRSGLVYQGGAESPPYKDRGFRYRHLYPVLKQIVEQGNEVHLIPGNADATTTYNNIGAFCYQPMVYDKLMAALRTKKYGLVVFNNEDLSQKQVNLTRTNKEQEYLACGLPLIVCGAPATAKWVKETGVGLCFDKISDIRPEVLEKSYHRCKAVVDKIVPDLTMEKHIYKLETLINKVIDRENR